MIKVPQQFSIRQKCRGVKVGTSRSTLKPLTECITLTAPLQCICCWETVNPLDSWRCCLTLIIHPNTLADPAPPPTAPCIPKRQWSPSRTMCVATPQKQLRNSPINAINHLKSQLGLKFPQLQNVNQYLGWFYMSENVGMNCRMRGFSLKHDTAAVIYIICLICLWF